MVLNSFRELRQPYNSLKEVLESQYLRRNLCHLPRGSMVPLLNDGIWLVVRGLVKIGAVTFHGDELLLDIIGPNELFGKPLTDLDAYEATALCECDLLYMSMEDVKRSPQLAFAMMNAIGARYRKSQVWIALLGLRRVEDRLWGFLELLSKDFGQPCERGQRLNICLTHQEIANALCTTRVTVARLIGVMRDEGKLFMDQRRRLVIVSPPQSGSTSQ